MSGPELGALLKRLAGGVSLEQAASEAGFGSTQAAADALVDLSERSLEPARKASRKRGPAKELPPDPPGKSPFPRGTRGFAQADGASRGNPGPASYGCVYLSADGVPLCGEGEAIGRATNNVAEYRGAIAALDRLLEWGVRDVVLRMDSQLVVRQLRGEYRVKNVGLQKLHAQACVRLRKFDHHDIQYIPRAQNALADALANRALDQALA